MLKRAPSLALRAGFIFVGIYLAIFVAGLVLISAQSLRIGGERHHAGANMAWTFASGDLIEDGGRLRIASNGAFADLAAKNPSLWLLAERDGRRFSFGPVAPGAEAMFDRLAGTTETAKFHVPGVPRPLSDSSFGRSGDMPLAAGGVDPATISLQDSLRLFMREGFFIVLVMLGTVGLIAMLVALPLLTRALKPVTAEAASIRPDSPGRRLSEAKVPRELLPLVRGFNAALDRLAGELARRKRFIADVAHELRTPLAIVSLQVESLPEEEPKDDLQRVVTRLSHLVAQMLDVERLSLATQERAEIDLAALAADVAADMAPMAMAAGYEISFSAPERPVRIQGDPLALGRAIANLIGNAVAHGGGTGQIEVRVGEERTVEVGDEGPGVAPSIRDSLFEPFSRERWDRDGCGLGLHLTREIMRSHGGDALLVDSERGAAFRLVFAAPSSPTAP